MGAESKIEWTDATFNIVWGCEKISPGCKNCYADSLSSRYGFDVWGADKARRVFGDKHWQEPLAWNRKAEKRGAPMKVFCSSMCDIGEDHQTVAKERAKLWPLIKATPWLIWQLLTKRADRLAAILPADWGAGYANAWLGVSVEDQKHADLRVPHLLETPAAVRFLSVEPMLGPVNLDPYLGLECRHHGAHIEGDTGALVCSKCDETPAPDWVIIGGESGNGARPMHEEWARELAARCRRAAVPVFVKQMGLVYGKAHGGNDKGSDVIPADMQSKQFPEAGALPVAR